MYINYYNELKDQEDEKNESDDEEIGIVEEDQSLAEIGLVNPMGIRSDENLLGLKQKW